MLARNLRSLNLNQIWPAVLSLSVMELTMGVIEDTVSLLTSSKVTSFSLRQPKASSFVMMLQKEERSAGNYPAHLQFIIWVAVEMCLSSKSEFKTDEQLDDWACPVNYQPTRRRQSSVSPLSLAFTAHCSYQTNYPMCTSFHSSLGSLIQNSCKIWFRPQQSSSLKSINIEKWNVSS